MNLPSITPETFEVKVKDVVLTFREPLTSEYEIIYSLTSNTNDMESIAKLIASLLYGYEEDLEQRIEFIKKLPIQYINEVANGLSNYLSEKFDKKKE